MMTLYVLMSPRRQQQIEVSLARWKAQKRILKSHASRVCGKGHVIDGDNLYITTGGHKKCRHCRLDNKAAMRLRRKLGLPTKKRLNWKPDKGENHVTAKLKNHQITEILAAIAKGNTGASLAIKYGVSKTLISLIKRGRHRQPEIIAYDAATNF